jgi:hypothetical protein
VSISVVDFKAVEHFYFLRKQIWTDENSHSSPTLQHAPGNNQRHRNNKEASRNSKS